MLWNNKVSHLLGNNYNLAKRILLNQLKKFKDNPEKLEMIDQVFKDQRQLGIIERVQSPETIPEAFPGYSYLAHMPIFRPEKVSSPCRVVFLSNLNGKGASTISHNQAMLSGPSLNRKLSTALISLRFNQYLLCFDLKKAFLQIELEELDQYRLLFLWFKNIEKGDFSLVTYRNVRLSFGLRCSPTLLMLAMYKILIVDASNDPPNLKLLKQSIYHLMYMDNGAISSNSIEQLRNDCKSLESIFSPYQFALQQYMTNDLKLQTELDKNSNDETTTDVVKLLGIRWDRRRDVLFTNAMVLNNEAKTKRQILRSIAENFDPYGYNLPVMNRARLFLHSLQINNNITWDSILDDKLLHEWKLIAHQLNNSKQLEVPRFVGESNHSYRLVAFTDSSKELYGTTLYLHNLNTNQINFLLAKNRVVTKQLSSKSIPTLELHAIALGSEVLIDTYNELIGDESILPIKIVDLHLYTDSYVALNWLNLYNQLDKMKNLSIFTKNRLAKIAKLCEQKSITFKFVAGSQNPADYVTRTVSAKRLKRTDFLIGPDFLKKSIGQSSERQDLLEVLIPDPNIKQKRITTLLALLAECKENQTNTQGEFYQYLLNRYSTYRRLFNCCSGLFKFINFLKIKIKAKNPEKFQSLKCCSDSEIVNKVNVYLIKNDQKLQFPELVKYFKTSKVAKCEIPPLVTQLNLYMDQNNVIRVNSKFNKPSIYDPEYYCPSLLSRKSRLSELAVYETHDKLSHANRYTVLTDLRKKFWIPKCYSLVKDITKNCIICKKKHARPVRINQNAYRVFRVQPPSKPFQYIFLDHMGPYTITFGKNKNHKKVWVLVICCLWSRAVNLEVCYDFSADSFLKAFQMHIFTHGLCELCLSDLGSSIVAGTNKMSTFIFNDSEVHHFFKFNNIQTPKFEQYYKGRHELGSLVEICVKMSRNLVDGSVRNLVLDHCNFIFIVKQTVNLINRRPIAFKESLRDDDIQQLPLIITPEQLIYGRTLTAANIIPELHHEEEPNYEPSGEEYSTAYLKLQKARRRLINIYNDEFLQQLVQQATNRTNRYKPQKHHKLQEGDIVWLKEPMLKPNRYPLAIVIQVFQNELDEVTHVKVFKGDSGETLKRHVCSIIPMLTNTSKPRTNSEDPVIADTPNANNDSEVRSNKTQRKAAIEANIKNKQLLDKGLV